MASRLWPIDPSQRLEVAPLWAIGWSKRSSSRRRSRVCGWSPRLSQRLFAEVADEPGALPLLQETLVLLWERQKVAN